MDEQRITYTTARTDKGETVHWVHLGGRIVGLIQRGADGGYFYTPKGSKKAGATFLTLVECKRSLEAA